MSWRLPLHILFQKNMSVISRAGSYNRTLVLQLHLLYHMVDGTDFFEKMATLEKAIAEL